MKQFSLLTLALTIGAVHASEEVGLTTAERWNGKYAGTQFVYGEEPVVFLKDQIHRLGKGRALVLAAGEGRNAVYLAQQGFDVVAVDVSDRGLEKCRLLAKRRGVNVVTVTADLSYYDMGGAKYDLITDFYYHQPDLFPRILKALKPGGHFILQGFSRDQPSTNRFGPRNPDYLIRSNELLRYFDDHRVLHYEDTVLELDEGMHQGPGAVIRLLIEKIAP